jgi:hypothetical protein
VLLRRILRWLRGSRSASTGGDFGPLPPRIENDCVVTPHGGGWLHIPLCGPLQRGPAVDPLAPPVSHVDPRGIPPRGPLFRAAGNLHDGTAGRTP